MESPILLQSSGSSAWTTTVALGVLFVGLGYLIRFRGMTGLIAGFDPERAQVSEERLGDLVGTTLFVISLVTFAYALAQYQGFTGGTLRTAYGVVLVGLVAVAWLRAHGFAPSA